MSIDFDPFFIFSVYSVASFFDGEDISDTRDSVSSAIQTPIRFLTTVLSWMLYFQLFVLVFRYSDEILSLCLIHYVS